MNWKLNLIIFINTLGSRNCFYLNLLFIIYLHKNNHTASAEVVLHHMFAQGAICFKNNSSNMFFELAYN